MLLNTNTDQQITNAKSTQFTVSKSSAIFTLMTDKLYKDKPLAALRETFSNAIDTTDHAKALGFEPAAPHMFVDINDDTSTITCIDNGMGMTQEQIASVYTTLFDSSKSGDNGQTGGFGIGALAIFAVTDHFEIVTRARTDEKGRKYVVHRSQDGTPELTFVGEFPTPYGTQIEFAASKIPLHTRQTLLLIGYFNNARFTATENGKITHDTKITRHGTTGAAHIHEITGRLSHYDNGSLFINEIAHNIFAISPGIGNLARAHGNYVRGEGYGQVIIGSNLIDLNVNHSPIIRKMPVGSLSLTPARESFENTIENEKTLHQPRARGSYDNGELFSSFMYDCAPHDITANLEATKRQIERTIENMGGSLVYSEYLYRSATDSPFIIYPLPRHAIKSYLCEVPENTHAIYAKFSKGFDVTALQNAIKKDLALVDFHGFMSDRRPSEWSIDNRHASIPKPTYKKGTIKTKYTFMVTGAPIAINPDTVYYHSENYLELLKRLKMLKTLFPGKFDTFNAVLRSSHYHSANPARTVLNDIKNSMSEKDKKTAVKIFAAGVASRDARDMVSDNVVNPSREYRFRTLTAECLSFCGSNSGFFTALLPILRAEIKKELAKPQDVMFNRRFDALPPHARLVLNKRDLTKHIIKNLRVACPE